MNDMPTPKCDRVHPRPFRYQGDALCRRILDLNATLKQLWRRPLRNWRRIARLRGYRAFMRGVLERINDPRNTNRAGGRYCIP